MQYLYFSSGANIGLCYYLIVYIEILIFLMSRLRAWSVLLYPSWKPLYIGNGM